MSQLLAANARQQGDCIGFQDAHGRMTWVQQNEVDETNSELFSDPDALARFNDGLEDFADGRFVDFEL